MFKRGFTLLEISVLLGIVSIVLIILGTAGYSYRSKTLLRLQKQLISADLNYAQTLAQTKMQDTDIYFKDSGYTLRLKNEVLKEQFLQKDFRVSLQHFGFTPAGTPRYAGTLYLSNKNRPAAKLTIAVGSGLLNWTNL